MTDTLCKNCGWRGPKSNRGVPWQMCGVCGSDLLIHVSTQEPKNERPSDECKTCGGSGVIETELYEGLTNCPDCVFREVIMSTKSETHPTCCRKHWTEASGQQTMILHGLAVMNPVGMPFMACVNCGNKRCPKATDCGLECTGSNVPGQVGSIYE